MNQATKILTLAFACTITMVGVIVFATSPWEISLLSSPQLSIFYNNTLDFISQIQVTPNSSFHSNETEAFIKGIFSRLGPLAIGIVVSLITLVYSFLGESKTRIESAPQSLHTTSSNHVNENTKSPLTNSLYVSKMDSIRQESQQPPRTSPARIPQSEEQKISSSYHQQLLALREQVKIDMNDTKRQVIANQIETLFDKNQKQKSLLTLKLVDEENARDILGYLPAKIQHQFLDPRNSNQSNDIELLKQAYRELSRTWERQLTQFAHNKISPEIENQLRRLDDTELTMALQNLTPRQIARIVLYIGPERSARVMEKARHDNKQVFDKLLDSVTKLGLAENDHNQDHLIATHLYEVKLKNENNQHKRYLQFYKKLVRNADDVTADSILAQLNQENSAKDLIQKSIITANTIEHIDPRQRAEVIVKLSDLQIASLKESVSKAIYQEVLDNASDVRRKELKSVRNEFDLLSDFLQKKVINQCRSKLTTVLSDYRDSGLLIYHDGNSGNSKKHGENKLYS